MMRILLVLLMFIITACRNNKKIEYYPNGNKRLEAEVDKDNNVNGLLTTFYENGQLAYYGEYRNDKKIGIHKQYYENGTLKDEFLYELRDGIELLKERKKYKVDGLIYFHSKNVEKNFAIDVRNKDLHVGDTAKVEVKILNPTYENCAVIIGDFDENLNPLESMDRMKDFISMNNHSVVIEVVLKNTGKNVFTGLFRDFTIDLIPGNDSLGYRIAEESFFKFTIVASPPIDVYL